MPTCVASLACPLRWPALCPARWEPPDIGLWTKARKNAEARRLGYTKRRGVRLDKEPHDVSPTLSYNLGRDYSLRAGQEVSLLTRAGRIHNPYQGWSRQVTLLQEG